MQKTTFKTRIEKTEANLTPKEWTIWFADGLRKYPSYTHFALAVAKDESIIDKPYGMMKAQLQAKHGGSRSEDIRAYNDAGRRMWTEFVAGKHLIINVNSTLQSRVDQAGFEAAMHLQTLQTIILQESLGQLEESNEWVFAVKSLIYDLYIHRAAVKVIQDEQFDGHPILARNTESGLESVILMVENTIKHHNEYLEIRSCIDGDKKHLPIIIDELKPVESEIIRALVKEWLKLARFQSIVINSKNNDLTHDDYQRMVEKWFTA
jgi:hypothetical protein